MPTTSSDELDITEENLAQRCFHNRKGICKHVDSPNNICVMNVCPYWVSWDKTVRAKINEKLPGELRINETDHVEISHLVSANLELQLLMKEVL